MRAVQWFGGLHCCLTHCEAEPCPLLVFTSAVFVRSYSFFPQSKEIQSRNFLVQCECMVSASSIINWQLVVSVFLPTAPCFRLRRLWTLWVEIRSKKNNDVRKNELKHNYLLMTALLWFCDFVACWDIFFLVPFFVYFSDLEDFKTHRRSSVSVREGQGVVLLCGPPPHSGGKTIRSYFNGC